MKINDKLFSQIEDAKEKIKDIFDSWDWKLRFEICEGPDHDMVQLDVFMKFYEDDEDEYSITLYISEEKQEIHVYEDHDEEMTEANIWKQFFYDATSKLRKRNN